MFRIPSLVLSCALIAALLIAPSAFAAGEWRAVTAQELALPASSIEPGADAEATFWEVQVEERRESGSTDTRPPNGGSVRIELPVGYAIEESEPPKALKIEGIGRYLATLRLTSDARQLVYARSFRFGENGRMRFPVEGYPRLRQVFESVRERDALTLTLFDPAARE